MLIDPMGVSVDGFIADRDGGFAWTPPGDEPFRFHLEQVGRLGGHLLGRRLYERYRVDRSTRPGVGGPAPAA